jgi:hypothetical protein
MTIVVNLPTNNIGEFIFYRIINMSGNEFINKHAVGMFNMYAAPDDRMRMATELLQRRLRQIWRSYFVIPASKPRND